MASAEHPVPSPEQAQKLLELGHRVQSAIAFFEGRKTSHGQRHAATEPKHLRVGVNSALVETSALGALLFRKGVFTAEEYYDSLIEVWEREVENHRAMVKQVDPRLDV